jgi:hypothetical protein
MNFVITMIILLCLFVSTLISVFMAKKNNRKWISALTAFCINSVILGASSWILYSLDEVEQIFGNGNSGFYVLIFFIPVITWLNLVIHEFIRNRKSSTRYYL